MPTFWIYTLGCKVNQYESQYVREGLQRLGFQEATPGEKVDLCIVNTCTVTAESDLKSRKVIRQLARRHPEARIVVMGCYAARAPQELARLPGVVQLIPDKAQLPQWLAQLGLADPPQGISCFGSRHRAFVKVQDGCQQRCRYCIIPLVRPVLRSRPLGEVLEEIQRLVSAGYREIVLTGIHLGHYGRDLPGPQPTLADLVEQILKLPGSFRLRLSSLEAMEVTPELLRMMADRPDRLCPHLHLPLQSGSNRVLEQMGRPYRLEDFLRVCDQVRAQLDNPALTTDILVGFPGETEQDFQASCRAVEQVGFCKIHSFPFSPRPGTAAAQMPDRPPWGVVRRRCGQIQEIARQLRRRYMESLLGRSIQVLAEESLRLGEVQGLRIPLFPSSGGDFTAIKWDHITWRNVFDMPSNRDMNITQNGGSAWTPPGTRCPTGIGVATKMTQNGRTASPRKKQALEDHSPKGLVSPLCLLRGTSERYLPVYFLGPNSWIGHLIALQAHTLCEHSQGNLALWAESMDGDFRQPSGEGTLSGECFSGE